MSTGSCDDVDRACGYCDRTLQLLLRTFFEIILLRKGPESLPASWLVFGFAIVLMELSSLVAATLVDLGEDHSLVLSFLTGLVGMAIYASILFVTRFPHRLLQTLSAIVACGSILIFLFVAVNVTLSPLLGQDLARDISALVIFWSVPVEGHIIARAIGQHWYLGIAIAMGIFIVQFAFSSAMAGRI